MNEVLIIGAGLAGLACADALAAAGHSVRLIDKGRGPGGRMSTRRVELDGETLHFDHGAQYFTARHSDFVAQVDAWEKDGVVARWPAAGEGAWVGTPGMNAPVKALAVRHDVSFSTRAEKIERTGSGWTVHTGDGTQEARALVVAIPAEQAAELLAPVAHDFSVAAAQSRSAPCWSVMARFAQRLPLADGLKGDGPIGWAARNSAKPDRAGGECWMIHASPQRTRDLLDRPKEEAAQILLADFFAQHDIAPLEPTFLAAHRWLYAMADPRPGARALWDPAARIGACGDWLASPRVEGAFLSGRTLASLVGPPR